MSETYATAVRAMAHTEVERQQTVCGQCGEPVTFVEGIRGPERWRHVRTKDWQCAPLCKHCGQPAVVKIGGYAMGGGGMGFVLSHWECGTCAAKTCRVEHT